MDLLRALLNAGGLAPPAVLYGIVPGGNAEGGSGARANVARPAEGAAGDRGRREGRGGKSSHGEQADGVSWCEGMVDHDVNIASKKRYYLPRADWDFLLVDFVSLSC